jgi:hypothetical protein
VRVATTIIIAALIAAGPALAEWQDATETAPNGKKIAMQRTPPGKGAISKSGRDVSATLYLRCDNPFDDRNKYRSNDFWSVFVVFSEPVSSVDARTQYSFDGGAPAEGTFMFNPRGTAMFFTQQGEDTDFIAKFVKSNTLQINPALAWAGNPTVTFDIAGAAAALQQIPCHKKF